MTATLQSCVEDERVPALFFLPPNRPTLEAYADMDELAKEAQEFASGIYDIQVLREIESAFFRYPAGSSERITLLKMEAATRAALDKQPIGRIKIIGNETAKEALQRCLFEAFEAFPITVMSFVDWYRELYLYSEHWLRLRGCAISANPMGACVDCGKTTASPHVHHLRYKKIFDVTLSDLVVLCKGCHKTRHTKDQEVLA